MNLEFSKEAMADLEFWRKADRKQTERVTSLLLEIAQTPYSGRGKPEQLRGNLSGYWSRRINSKDRIVYRVDEVANTVITRALRKHCE